MPAMAGADGPRRRQRDLEQLGRLGVGVVEVEPHVVIAGHGPGVGVGPDAIPLGNDGEVGGGLLHPAIGPGAVQQLLVLRPRLQREDANPLGD